MQAVPVAVVQELAPIIYKDLGIENEQITRWTSLIGLPWALQMILGPLVDLNNTKRNWILFGHLAIGTALMVAAFTMRSPKAFETTLVILGFTALFSALTNIATDGFSILSMSKDQQAQFAGIMSTFYRLGRLFVVNVLVMLSGFMMRMPAIEVEGAPIMVKDGGNVVGLDKAKLVIKQFKLADADGRFVEPEIAIPPGTYQLRISPYGVVSGTSMMGDKELGKLQVPADTRLKISGPVASVAPPSAWFAVLLLGACVYGALHLAVRATMPKPQGDKRAVTEPKENRANIVRTVYLLVTGLSGYFVCNAIVRLVAHALWANLDGKPRPDDPKLITGLQGWQLPVDNKVLGISTGLPAVVVEWVQLVTCASLFVFAVSTLRKSMRGTEMADAIGTYIRQPGFPAILFFLTFYRLPEAVIGRLTPLFLKDPIEKGGLAVTNDQLGALSGGLGVIGIIVGGILGGLAVSKLGLKRCFVFLFLAMNVPNVMYWMASMKMLPMSSVTLPFFGEVNGTLGLMLIVDQFGYGFGFAGYMVYLMWVAQRGNFVTSHYAIGTGIGAMLILVAGVISGLLQKNFGYPTTFMVVLALSIPSMAAILMVPLDESHKKIKAELAD